MESWVWRHASLEFLEMSPRTDENAHDCPTGEAELQIAARITAFAHDGMKLHAFFVLRFAL